MIHALISAGPQGGPVAEAIRFVIGNYMTTFLVVGLIVGALQVVRHRGHRTTGAASGILLNAYVLFAIGIGQTVNFVMHSLLGDMAARSIGWAQSPFQLELAFASLGTGVMAFILHGRRSALRGKVAVVVATAIFNAGAAGGHVYQMVVHHDYAVNNTGLLFVTDLLVPAVGIALVIVHAVTRDDPRGLPTDAVEERREPVAAR